MLNKEKSLRPPMAGQDVVYANLDGKLEDQAGSSCRRWESRA